MDVEHQCAGLLTVDVTALVEKTGPAQIIRWPVDQGHQVVAVDTPNPVVDVLNPSVATTTVIETLATDHAPHPVILSGQPPQKFQGIPLGEMSH